MPAPDQFLSNLAGLGPPYAGASAQTPARHKYAVRAQLTGNLNQAE